MAVFSYSSHRSNGKRQFLPRGHALTPTRGTIEKHRHILNTKVVQSLSLLIVNLSDNEPWGWSGIAEIAFSASTTVSSGLSTF